MTEPAHSTQGDVVPKDERSGSRWILWTTLAVLALYGLFVLLLWQAGVLSFDERTSDSQRFAAVLGLLGGLFASSLTFVGVVLKHSLDERNTRIAEDEARRLKLEASIKAVDLLATPDRQPASAVEQAGALFTLTHLGQVELAVILLGQTWKPDGVSTSAACGIIERGLADENLQGLAAEVLRDNAAQLFVPPGEAFLPNQVWEWPPTINDYARGQMVAALGDLMLAHPEGWTENGLISLMWVFDTIREDRTPEIAAMAALLQDTVLQAITLEDDQYFFTPEGDVEIGPLRDEVAGIVNEAYSVNRSDWNQLVAKIRGRWQANGSG